MKPEDELGYHAAFAEIYDAMRAAYLDVAADCNQLLAATEAAPGATVLDLGSGTGVHAAELARRGHGVVGIEPSPSMSELARERTKELGSVEVHTCTWEDLGRAVPDGTVDVAVSFANVLNCMTAPTAISEALTALRRALRPGGRALLDVWNREPIEANGTRPTVRQLDTEHGTMVQASTADLEGDRLTIDYRIFVPEADGRFRQVTSTHRLRILTTSEYRQLFDAAGLAVVAVLPQRPRSLEPITGDQPDLQAWIVQRPA